MIPDLDSLRCFEAAASRPSFRLAATAVHLSPTAFSERIRRLEELLDARLFERTTRRVALTPAGLRLLPQARRVLEEAARCGSVVAERDVRLPFELTIGTRFELGLSWLVPALVELGTRRPERTLHLYFGDSDELIARLGRGTLDAVVTSVRIHSAGHQHQPLHEETYVLVGAPKLLAATPLRGPDDAAHHVLVDAHADLPLFRYFRDARGADEVWAFSKVLRLGTIGAIRHVVLEGAGVAVLPEYLVRGDLEKKRLVRLFPRSPLTRDWFRLIWRDRHALSTELETLASDLRRLPLR